MCFDLGKLAHGKIAGEKAFLFTLHRLATVERLVDFEKTYGRTCDQLSLYIVACDSIYLCQMVTSTFESS